MQALISKLRTMGVAMMTCYVLAFSSPSSAAAYQVTFDPYTELYGTAIFNVQDSCLANNNHYNTFYELLHLVLGGCYITFEGAHISTDGFEGEYTDYTGVFDLVIFSSLLVVNNEFAGLTTLIPIFLEPVSASEVAGFSLQSTNPHECYETLSFTAVTSVSPLGGVVFTGCGPDGQPLHPLTGDVIRIAQVPEPGTLALLFGAGVALWWSRRRRVAATASAA